MSRSVSVPVFGFEPKVYVAYTRGLFVFCPTQNMKHWKTLKPPQKQQPRAAGKICKYVIFSFVNYNNIHYQK